MLKFYKEITYLLICPDVLPHGLPPCSSQRY